MRILTTVGLLKPYFLQGNLFYNIVYHHDTNKLGWQVWNHSQPVTVSGDGKRKCNIPEALAVRTFQGFNFLVNLKRIQ